MAAISSMTRFVALSAPGCPDVVVEDYLLQAAIDLCRRSFVWRETVQEPVSPLDYPFQLSAPTWANVLKVLSIVGAGVAPGLEELTIRECDDRFVDWRTAPGVPAYYVNDPRDTVMLVPIPTATTTFDITLAYEPTSTATNIPDALYTEHRDTIVAGALMRLCMMPGKDWSNPSLALANRAMFEAGVSAASREFHLNYSHAALTVTPSPL